MQWQSSWIWLEGEPSPRNAWVCFRKSFELDRHASRVEEARLSITADSRYVLYVNGQLVGRGPVRSWPFEQAYDTYDLRHLLRPGRNCLAVLVTHFGASTFSYVRGRGGCWRSSSSPPTTVARPWERTAPGRRTGTWGTAGAPRAYPRSRGSSSSSTPVPGPASGRIRRTTTPVGRTPRSWGPWAPRPGSGSCPGISRA